MNIFIGQPTWIVLATEDCWLLLLVAKRLGRILIGLFYM